MKLGTSEYFVVQVGKTWLGVRFPVSFRAPKPYEYFVCRNCKTPIMDEANFDESSELDSYWCDRCVDYVDVIVRTK